MNNHKQRFGVLCYAFTCFVSTVSILMLDQGILKVAARTYEKPIAFVLFFVLLSAFAIAASSFWRYFRSLWFGSYVSESIAASVCGVILALGWFGLPILIQNTTQIDYYLIESESLRYCYGFMTFGFWTVISVECEAFLSIRRSTSVRGTANA